MMGTLFTFFIHAPTAAKAKGGPIDKFDHRRG
jgi:hypothetical protein